MEENAIASQGEPGGENLVYLFYRSAAIWTVAGMFFRLQASAWVISSNKNTHSRCVTLRFSDMPERLYSTLRQVYCFLEISLDG
jgi:hypothetical protein